jgi:hypothetical protein
VELQNPQNRKILFNDNRIIADCSITTMEARRPYNNILHMLKKRIVNHVYPIIVSFKSQDKRKSVLDT